MTSSKHDYANYDQFPPNFDMAYKTIERVPNLKLFGSINKVMGQRNFRFFHYVMWENGLGAFFCPPAWLLQYTCTEIF